MATGSGARQTAPAFQDNFSFRGAPVSAGASDEALQIGNSEKSMFGVALRNGKACAPNTPVGAGVLFDSVVIFRQNGTTTVNRFTDPATVLSGALSFAGDTVSGSIAGSLLPSTGFDKSSYTWNLWPRDALATGNAQIADFAPDASNAAVGVVSEPHSHALVALALGGMAWVSRRRATRSS